MSAPLSGEKILITGATGQVANPVAKALARDNEVWAVARFGNARAREDLEDAGVHCAVVDLAAGDYSGVPGDVTYGLHFARASVGEWGADLDTNVGGLASLMEFCQSAKAFLHCSSTAVYQPNGNTPRFKEDDPLGDNHRVYESFMPDMQTYSITKIAAEGAARWGARRFDLPTTIARLNVPYGSAFSWPAFHLDMMMEYPEPVACQKQRLFPRIPDGNGELAVESLQTSLAQIPDACRTTSVSEAVENR